MKHIVVDLEMNHLARNYKEERLICSMEVIEIGAVVLDEADLRDWFFQNVCKTTV